MKQEHFICCHECDEIVKIPTPHKKGRYKCPNCNHTLFKYWPDMIERVYALSLASFTLFIVSLSFPFLSFEVLGNQAEITLFTSVYYLYLNGDFILSVTVLFTTIAIPLSCILVNIAILAPIYHRGKAPFYTVVLLKLQHSLSPWGMVDVFLVGVLVSIVKLVKMGTLISGVAIWSFGILTVIMAYIQTIYDPHQIWELVDERKKAIRRGL